MPSKHNRFVGGHSFTKCLLLVSACLAKQAVCCCGCSCSTGGDFFICSTWAQAAFMCFSEVPTELLLKGNFEMSQNVAVHKGV